jgi:hypothetical protein
MGASMSWIIRTSGPADVALEPRIGPRSWGSIIALPLNTPIHVKALSVRGPAADGPSHNSAAGSKREVSNITTKSSESIIGEIKREFHALEFHTFATREEATNFCNGVPDDWTLLGVDRGASAKEIRKAWIRSQQLAHPDKGGSIKLSQAINAAYLRLESSHES